MNCFTLASVLVTLNNTQSNQKNLLNREAKELAVVVPALVIRSKSNKPLNEVSEYLSAQLSGNNDNVIQFREFTNTSDNSDPRVTRIEMNVKSDSYNIYNHEQLKTKIFELIENFGDAILEEIEVIIHNEDNINSVYTSGEIKSEKIIEKSNEERNTAPIRTLTGSDNVNEQKESLPSRLKPEFMVAADEKAIGKILSQAREKAGLTKVAVAKMVGTSEGAIRSLEAGKNSPSIRTLKRYTDAVGLKIEIHLTSVENE